MKSPARSSILGSLLVTAFLLVLTPLAEASGGAQGSGQDPPEVTDDVTFAVEGAVSPWLVEVTSVLVRIAAL